MSLKLAIIGATGRMGKAIESVYSESNQKLTPLSLLNSQDSISDVFRVVEEFPQVCIDFSSPSGCMDALAFCVGNNIPFVTGTTGLSDDQQTQILDAAKRIPVFQAANFSVGVHLLAKAVQQTAAATSIGDWDIEIFEAHHRNKVDAPGGTALFLGERAAEARGQKLDEIARLERSGHTGKRSDDEIGFQVLRGGSIVGTHKVSFCAEGELIEFSHQALDRTIFARGALRSSAWIVNQAPGLYGMEDLLFS